MQQGKFRCRCLNLRPRDRPIAANHLEQVPKRGATTRVFLVAPARTGLSDHPRSACRTARQVSARRYGQGCPTAAPGPWGQGHYVGIIVAPTKPGTTFASALGASPYTHTHTHVNGPLCALYLCRQAPDSVSQMAVRLSSPHVMRRRQSLDHAHPETLPLCALEIMYHWQPTMAFQIICVGRGGRGVGTSGRGGGRV
eukprot:361688-Chlamydomonas_euryale.AAC.3